jgi:hypothetical protein
VPETRFYGGKKAVSVPDPENHLNSSFALTRRANRRDGLADDGVG